jgi:hypothetical protein
MVHGGGDPSDGVTALIGIRHGVRRPAGLGALPQQDTGVRDQQSDTGHAAGVDLFDPWQAARLLTAAEKAASRPNP